MLNARGFIYSFTFFCLAVTNFALATTTSDIPIKDFWKHSEFVQIEISPTGEYFAATVPRDETRTLVIFRRDNRKVTGVAQFGKTRNQFQIGNFSWIAPDRVAFTINEKQGSLDIPSRRGELFFMDTKGKQSTAYAGGARTALITNTLREDDESIITTDWVPQAIGTAQQVLSRVNAYTGKSKLITTAPIPFSSFLVTPDGSPQVAYGSRGYRKSEVYHYQNKKWKKAFSESREMGWVQPWHMNTDGQSYYALVNERKGPHSVYLIDFDGNRKLVVQDKTSDPSNLTMSLDGRDVIAVEFDSTTPRRTYINAKHPDAVLLRSLEQSFPGQWVDFLNANHSGELIVFKVRSDRNPGEFYLFDRKQKQAKYLASVAQWIDADSMATVEAVDFVSRDGQPIHAWLTLPKDSEGKNLPMIVNPHGGPHGPYDSWRFNREVQLWASRGYAVLQPNFRGSGGFGTAFEEAGYREWGGKMQDDVTDATHWAIKQGIADPKRICIAGASYGAYASLMGVAKEPDLYQCAVGYVGVYEMSLFFTRGDIPDDKTGIDYLEEVIGRDADEQKKRSPAQQVEHIKAPVFIVAGGDDVRTPPVQSKFLVDKFKEAGKSNLVEEFYIEKGERHGFYKVENNVKLYEKMLAFFERHIGKGKPSSTNDKAGH
jgi:dipeptidyl aminopeptidase/acylaminoacyl peptidase